MSQAEELLAVQLRAARIDFEREVTFAPPRKWRADFRIGGDLLVEVDGVTHFGKNANGTMRLGRHQTHKGVSADCEKTSAAAILGYRVIRVTQQQVRDGVALQWIEQACATSAAGL